MQKFFEKYKTASVALSGGADSAAVLLLACRYLGKENVTAYTCINNHVFRYEIDIAERVSKKLNVRHIEFTVEPSERFIKNTKDRCYHCKLSVLEAISKLSTADVILDGTNADDDPTNRPGFRAIAETGIVSPLRELGLGKAFTADIVKEFGIEFYDESCKATRISGIISKKKMDCVEDAEDLLRYKYNGIRYRVDDNRIEFKSPKVMAASDFTYIAEVIKEVGQRH